jgi:hypothetical protein
MKKIRFSHKEELAKHLAKHLPFASETVYYGLIETFHYQLEAPEYFKQSKRRQHETQ